MSLVCGLGPAMSGRKDRPRALCPICFRFMRVNPVAETLRLHMRKSWGEWVRCHGSGRMPLAREAQPPAKETSHE